MPIQPTQAITVRKKIQAEQEIVHDSVWITSMTVRSTPTRTSARVVFTPWTAGTESLSPEGNKAMNIPDLYAAASQDVELAGIVQALIDKLGRMGKAANVI